MSRAWAIFQRTKRTARLAVRQVDLNSAVRQAAEDLEAAEEPFSTVSDTTTQTRPLDVGEITATGREREFDRGHRT